MNIWRLFSLVLALLLVAVAGSRIAYAQLTAPTFTVNTAATFKQGQGPIVIAPTLTLNAPDGNIERAAVSITNFVATEDRLGISGQTGASGAVGNLAWAYDETTGILTLTGSDTQANYQAALQQVTYDNVSETPKTTSRQASFTLGHSLYFEGNKHYYEYVSSTLTWDQAKTAAEGRSFHGLQGYLVTVTSAEENKFIATKLQGNSWMGASDAEKDKQWKWVTGPEAGTWFYTQNGYDANGNNTCDVGPAAEQPDGTYYNWESGEPNDYLDSSTQGCAGGEDYAHFYATGTWNDWPATTTADGYVVEYGGMPNDPVLSLSGEVEIKVVKAVNPVTNTWGDVHIRTPDGLVYDFQEVGDFLLAQSASGDVMVQT